MATRVTTAERNAFVETGSAWAASKRSQVSCTASSASTTLPRIR